MYLSGWARKPTKEGNNNGDYFWKKKTVYLLF